MQSVDFAPAQFTANSQSPAPWTAEALARRPAVLDFADSAAMPILDFQDSEITPPLHLRVLRTARQREQLAVLRQHAPMGVEDDLGAGLMPFEAKRDEVGVVTAIYRGTQLLATIRFVPSGHALTAAERIPGGIGEQAGVLGKGNWEVGRLIVAPGERSPELLHSCLTLALQALIEEREVRNFYAIATPLMARLWRRFGMRPAAPLRGASGREFMLVSGPVSAVAAALDVPLPAARPAALQRRHHGSAVALAA